MYYRPPLTHAVSVNLTMGKSIYRTSIYIYLFREYLISNFKATLLERDSDKGVSCEFCKIFKNINFVKYLFRETPIYCLVDINLGKNLLMHDSLLIHLIQLCQKYNNKRNAFDSITNSK